MDFDDYYEYKSRWYLKIDITNTKILKVIRDTLDILIGEHNYPQHYCPHITLMELQVENPVIENILESNEFSTFLDTEFEKIADIEFIPSITKPYQLLGKSNIRKFFTKLWQLSKEDMIRYGIFRRSVYKYINYLCKTRYGTNMKFFGKIHGRAYYGDKDNYYSIPTYSWGWVNGLPVHKFHTSILNFGDIEDHNRKLYKQLVKNGTVCNGALDLLSKRVSRKVKRQYINLIAHKDAELSPSII